MAIYSRWGDPLTITNARYELMPRPGNPQETFPALIVDIKYEGGDEQKGVWGSFLRADNGLQEITETINALKGYDMWERFNKPKAHPVKLWVLWSHPGSSVHLRVYREGKEVKEYEFHNTPASQRYIQMILKVIRNNCTVQPYQDEKMFGYFSLECVPVKA
jgi:hypothetical protein